MNFPKSITAVHQIEISSRCQLKCVYCPSKNITAGKYPDRPALDMTRAHFERALDWVKFFVRQRTQAELNIAGIGESTMHTDWVDFVKLAREALPDGKLIFATNGLIHDEEMVKAIAPYKPEVWVSLHRPEKAGPAVEMYKKYGILAGASADPSISANDWAGQVSWFNSGDRIQCQWLRQGKVFVLADGRISRCCLDASGNGVIGHVDDPIGSVETSPWDLCRSCYQEIGIVGWNQKKGIEEPA